jgi:hypothetical protein
MQTVETITSSLNSTNAVLADVALVKSKFPKADVARDGALFFCYEGLKDLGAGFSKEAAWRSAACNIR